MPANGSSKLPADKREEIAIEEVRRALKGLRYGCVTIVVQDGIVIQVERSSKTRIDYSGAAQVSEGAGI